MIIVGDHLTEAAFSRTNNSETDLFARSAFNRYYYAVFLIVKEKISVIKPEWGVMSHKHLPKVIKGQVITIIKNDIKRKIKKGVFKPNVGESIKRTVIHSANELANILENAYRIRVIADYEPKTKVKIINSTLFLGGEKSSDAKRWKNDAQIYLTNILEAYKDVGLITD